MDTRKLIHILKLPLYFFGGLIFSLPYTGGTFSPFAAAFTASCEGIYSIISAAGSIIGVCFFHSGLTAFRYFSVIFTTVATLNIAAKVFRTGNDNLLRILCPSACCFAVNTLFLISQKISIDLISSIICETALCALSVPVFREAVTQLHNKSVLQKIQKKDKNFICFILSLTLAVSHIRYSGLWGESICCFAFFFLILAFSDEAEFYGSIVTGICCSFTFAMNGEADFACIMFSLCSSIFVFLNIENRIIKSLIAVACAFFGSTFGEYTEFLPIVPSAFAAGILYSILPEKIYRKNYKESENSSVANPIIDYKSNGIASAVGSLSDCVSAVRKALTPITIPAPEKELIRAKNRICSQCEICDSCINEIKNNDSPCYKKILEGLACGELDYTYFPEKFDATCFHSSKMISEMKKAYFVHCTNISASQKINRMQTLTGNQFKTFGGIIGQACEAVSGDNAVSSKHDTVCATCAENFGVEIKDARLCSDKAGREFYDISFIKNDNNFNVTALTEKLKESTGYELDFPTLIQNGNIYDLIFKQKEALSFSIAAAVKPASGKKVCGDYYRCFKDSFSRQTVLLSDGMGTGSRAAVDSAFTCETFCNLIKSGLDEKTAAAAVNCAMIIKSTDESFSTIDFLRLDPILKTAEIFKCGAAPSFVLKKKKAVVIETESTPIGILDNVNMSATSFEIEAGDKIIIASDGVSSDRFGWIGNELKSWKGTNAGALAKHILQCAADRKIGKRSDDMTVIAICVAEK